MGKDKDLPTVEELAPGLFSVDYRRCESITSDAMMYVRDSITQLANNNPAEIRILLDLRGMHKYALDAVAFATAKRAFTVKKSAWIADERNLDIVERVFPSAVVGHVVRAFAEPDEARAWLMEST